MAKVELYTNKGCGACVNAKRLFDRKGVEYEEKKLGTSARMDREYLIRTKGSKSVPQIFIDNVWVGGFDDLMRYEHAGELDWRLGLEDRPKVSLVRKFIRIMRGQTF
ncbi:MAG: glutaredoxin domain-containing protein [Candidatus Poseidoniaceae archaeon]|jgi:glutaredoxin 3|tara:strand:+ start:3541 stop:3861 length:321 start_codon:yes stop_codon:yes gene_type:complete